LGEFQPWPLLKKVGGKSINEQQQPEDNSGVSGKQWKIKMRAMVGGKKKILVQGGGGGGRGGIGCTEKNEKKKLGKNIASVC